MPGAVLGGGFQVMGGGLDLLQVVVGIFVLF